MTLYQRLRLQAEIDEWRSVDADKRGQEFLRPDMSEHGVSPASCVTRFPRPAGYITYLKYQEGGLANTLLSHFYDKHEAGRRRRNLPQTRSDGLQTPRRFVRAISQTFI